MARVTLGFSGATRTPTPGYPYPHHGVRVFADTGCGFYTTDEGIGGLFGLLVTSKIVCNVDYLV
jgi:hypothetical protein